MATSAVPPVFRGTYREDAQTWLETVKWYIRAERNQTEKNKIAHAGMLMGDDAKRWFKSLDVREPPGEGDDRLSQGAITTFEELSELFLEHFRREQGDLWREQSMIWSCKQRPGQKTDDFLNELIEIADRARATADQVRMAALAGLRDDVKAYCLGHELPDLQAIKRRANAFEMCSGNTTTDVNRAVKER